MKEKEGGKRSLKDRLNKSYDSRDKGGGSRPQALDFKGHPDISFFKPVNKKNYRVNILPYVIKTKKDPLVFSEDAEIGGDSYVYDIYIHNYIGATQADVICPKMNFNKACPICDMARTLKDKGKDKESKALSPKRKCYYNIVDLDDQEKGVQVFVVSQFLFEKELIEEARDAAGDGDIVDFPDLKNGKVVSFRTAQKTMGAGKPFIYYKKFGFEDRESDDKITKEQRLAVISFDEIAVVHSASEIEDIFKVAEDDDDDEEDNDAEDEDEDDDDGEDEDDDEEDDPVPAKGKGKSGNSTSRTSNKAGKKASNSRDDETEDDDSDSEDEDDDEEDDDPKPTKKAKGSSKTSGKEKETGSCPKGKVFGTDCDTIKFCDKCDFWEACKTQQVKMKKGKK